MLKKYNANELFLVEVSFIKEINNKLVTNPVKYSFVKKHSFYSKIYGTLYIDVVTKEIYKTYNKNVNENDAVITKIKPLNEFGFIKNKKFTEKQLDDMCKRLNEIKKNRLNDELTNS